MRYPVYLVDDDHAVRQGLELLFEAYQIKVQSFGDPVQFLEAAVSSKPGCLLFDLQMPQLTGMELQRELNARGINWPIVMITGHGDLNNCRSAFQSGIVDFLAKPVDTTALLDALRKADHLLSELLEKREIEVLLATLSVREHEVLGLICQGWGSKDISMALDISVRTVDAHRANISSKLGTTSVAEFVRLQMTVN